MGSTARHLVLFVHGLGGAPVGTWGSFERLLRADGDLGQLEVGHFSFPTFIFRLPFGPKYPGVPMLAQALATQIDHRHVDAEEITLVCHSLGGLIGKQYLIDCLSAKRAVRVKRAVFYAVPNNGASLAAVASLISWGHPQLRQLCHESDAVRAIGIGWERENVEDIVDVRYVVAAQDRVVDEESARKSWGNDRVDVVVDRGHVDVVKPLDANDLSYLILKNHIARSRSGAVRQVPAPREPAWAGAASTACGSDVAREEVWDMAVAGLESRWDLTIENNGNVRGQSEWPDNDISGKYNRITGSIHGNGIDLTRHLGGQNAPGVQNFKGRYIQNGGAAEGTFYGVGGGPSGHPWSATVRVNHKV